MFLFIILFALPFLNIYTIKIWQGFMHAGDIDETESPHNSKGETFMEASRSRTKAQRAAGSATSKRFWGIIRTVYGTHMDNAVTI